MNGDSNWGKRSGGNDDYFGNNSGNPYANDSGNAAGGYDSLISHNRPGKDAGDNLLEKIDMVVGGRGGGETGVTRTMGRRR